MSWTSLHNHSHYSILDGYSKPDKIAENCIKLGQTAFAITDHGNISAAIEICKMFKGVCAKCGKQKDEKLHQAGRCSFEKAKLKPILGNELYICHDNMKLHTKENGLRNSSHLVVLAKNLAGWKNLIKLTSESNHKENFYYKPRLDLEALSKYTDGNLISFSGHLGSHLAKAALSQDITEVCDLARQYESMFGKGNFFIEKQKFDIGNETQDLVADIMTEVSLRTGIPIVATADSHYVEMKDYIDQQVSICSSLKTTFKKVYDALANNEDVGLSCFFKSSNFYIPSYEQLQLLHSPQEIEQANIIAEMCEDYDILGKTKIPSFPCPNGITQKDYLKQLCMRGWDRLVHNKGLNEQEYRSRLDYELDVIYGATLEGYFLIVQDYVNWAKNQGYLVGPGRGSGAGSLVSYLTGITTVDPIKYNLLFERFYNAGRNTKDHVSLPDIDIDFPKFKRDNVVKYVKQKFGYDKVASIGTFGKLKGRGALREVLRVHEACSNDTINQITKNLPQEAKIASELEESEEESTLRWTLENNPKALKEYCTLNDDGTFSGPYAIYFEQATRIEGTYKAIGEHASGIVISDDVIADVCPIREDDEGNTVTAIDMHAVEGLGYPKFDFLGLALLDKLQGVNDLLMKGTL